MTVGLAVVFTSGVLWLALFAAPAPIGMRAAIATGLVPFFPADVFKLFVAAAVLPAVWKLIGK
jgi:biotin transport system substrate-specific component